jgi:hypothetical protein
LKEDSVLTMGVSVAGCIEGAHCRARAKKALVVSITHSFDSLNSFPNGPNVRPFGEGFRSNGVGLTKAF